MEKLASNPNVIKSSFNTLLYQGVTGFSTQFRQQWVPCGPTLDSAWLDAVRAVGAVALRAGNRWTPKPLCGALTRRCTAPKPGAVPCRPGSQRGGASQTSLPRLQPGICAPACGGGMTSAWWPWSASASFHPLCDAVAERRQPLGTTDTRDG